MVVQVVVVRASGVAGHGVDGSTGRGGAGFWCSPLMRKRRA